MRNTRTVFIIPLTLLPLHYTGRPRSQFTFSVHVKMLSVAVIIQMSTKQGLSLKLILPPSQSNGAKWPAVKTFDTKTQPTEYKLKRWYAAETMNLFTNNYVVKRNTSILLPLPQIGLEFSRPQPGTAMPGEQQDNIYFTRYYSWNVMQSWCRPTPRCRPAALEIFTGFTLRFSKLCSASAIGHSQFS